MTAWIAIAMVRWTIESGVDDLVTVKELAFPTLIVWLKLRERLLYGWTRGREGQLGGLARTFGTISTPADRKSVV